MDKIDEDHFNKWGYRFLDMADTVSSWSKDPSTKVGAVIVDPKLRVLSVGYNGFPRNVVDHEAWYYDREMKHLLVCHAERNALDQCFQDVEGCYMFSTLYPCNECAKSIAQRGISRVYTYDVDNQTDRFNWVSTKKIFEAANIASYFLARS